MCPGDEIESRNTDKHLQTINRLTEKLCKNAQQVKDMIPPGCSQTSEDFMTKTTEDSPQVANLWCHGRSVCYWSFPGFYKYKVKAFGLGLFLCTPASVMLPFILFWFKYGFPWFLCISIIIVLSWVCWYFNILVSVSTYGYFIGFLVFWFIGYANKSVLSLSGLPLSSFFVRACVPCGSLIFLDFCLLPFWT